MHKHRLIILLSLLLPAFAGVASAQTADEVVEKHIAALGGRAALAKITSRKLTGTITLATATVQLSGPAEIYSKGPNKSRSVMKLDVTALGASGDMTVEQIFDGVTGFSLNNLQGDTEIGGRQIGNMRNNAFPTPLLTYKDAGLKLEVLPKAQVSGRDAIVLRVTPKTGPAYTVFFDAETYLVARTVTLNDAPDGSELVQTSEPSDYRTVDGVKVAFMYANSNDLQTLTLKVAKVEHNIAMDDAMFVKK